MQHYDSSKGAIQQSATNIEIAYAKRLDDALLRNGFKFSGRNSSV